MYKAKNIKLESVTEDTGWFKAYERGCITEWMRKVKTNRTPESIVKELVDAGDHDGWTGVQYVKGYSTDGWLAFISTWDSTD